MFSGYKETERSIYRGLETDTPVHKYIKKGEGYMAYKKHTVATEPYDTSLEDNMSMYDKLKYKRDADLCNASTLALNSGNLVKYYRCSYEMESKEIGTHDSEFKQIAVRHIREQEKAEQERHELFPILYGPLEGALSDNQEYLEDNEDFDSEDDI